MKTGIAICLLLSAATLILVIALTIVVVTNPILSTKKEWEEYCRWVRNSADDDRKLRERLLETYHNPAEAEMAYVYIKEGKVVSVKPASAQGDGKCE